MSDSVEELKSVLVELVNQRVELAYRLAGAHDEDGLNHLAAIQAAITAVDAVIESGAQPPAPSKPQIIRW
jgi:hypothetical protein